MAFLQLVLLLRGNLHPWSSHRHRLHSRQRGLDVGIWHSSLVDDSCDREFLHWIALLPLRSSCGKPIHSTCTSCGRCMPETKTCVTKWGLLTSQKRWKWWRQPLPGLCRATSHQSVYVRPCTLTPLQDDSSYILTINHIPKVITYKFDMSSQVFSISGF